MKIIVDYDNDQILFGSYETRDDDLTDISKPKTMKEVCKLLYEILNLIADHQPGESVTLDVQSDGEMKTVEEWSL